MKLAARFANGISVAPRSAVKNWRAVFDQFADGDGRVKPCLTPNSGDSDKRQTMGKNPFGDPISWGNLRRCE